jgi:hypothetical protein
VPLLLGMPLVHVVHVVHAVRFWTKWTRCTTWTTALQKKDIASLKPVRVILVGSSLRLGEELHRVYGGAVYPDFEVKVWART